MRTSTLTHYLACHSAMAALTAAARSGLEQLNQELERRDTVADLALLQAAVESGTPSPAFLAALARSPLAAHITGLQQPVPSTEGLLDGLKSLIWDVRESAPKRSHNLDKLDLSGPIDRSKHVDHSFLGLGQELSQDYPARYTYKKDTAKDIFEGAIPAKDLIQAFTTMAQMPAMLTSVLALPIPHSAKDFTKYVKDADTKLAVIEESWGERLNDHGLFNMRAGGGMAKRETGTAKQLGYGDANAFTKIFTALKSACTISGASMLQATQRKLEEVMKAHDKAETAGADTDELRAIENYGESIYTIAMTMVLGFMDTRYMAVNMFIQALNHCHDFDKE